MASLRSSSHRNHHHDRYEASIEILTDGSELTEPAIFLTIRRRRVRRRRIDDDDGRRDEGGGTVCNGEPSSTSSSSSSSSSPPRRGGGPRDDDDCYYYDDGRRLVARFYRRDDDDDDDEDDDEVEQGGGRGMIVSRYGLTGLPSLAGRLSSDQSFNILGGGGFRAVLLPSLVGCGSPSSSCRDDEGILHDDHDGLGGGGNGGGGIAMESMTTTRGACLAGLPSLFLGLVHAGYGVDTATPTACNPPPSPPPSSDYDDDGNHDENDDENVRDVGVVNNSSFSAGTLYGEVCIVGPIGTVDAIDGIVDVVFGDNVGHRRRPSVRACEVPPSNEGGVNCWWEVYRDSHLRVWGRSVTVSTGGRDEDSPSREGEWHSIVYVVMLLPNGNDNVDDDDYNDDAPYSFAIIPHGSLPLSQLRCAANDQRRQRGGGRHDPNPLWDALRDLPQEVVSCSRRQWHENSTAPLDFILHLNPVLAVVVDSNDDDNNDQVSDRRSGGDDLVTSRKRKRTETTTEATHSAGSSWGKTIPVYEIPIPSWATESALACHHLVTHPVCGVHPGGDEGILIRARQRLRFLNERLPFAFPLSSDRTDRKTRAPCNGRPQRMTSTGNRREGGGYDRIIDKFDSNGSSIALAYGLRSCTSVILNGWHARRNDINATRRLHFGFISRIESILDRCEGGSSSRSELDGDFDDELTNDDANSTNAIRSVECAFRGTSCRFDECLDGLSIANNVDDNEIDLDDSFSDRNIAQVRICADDVNLLIHESTFLDDLRGRSDAIRKRHSTTAEALNVACNMNAEACILTHFSQRYRHISIVDASSGQDSHPFSWGIAYDGMMTMRRPRAVGLAFAVFVGSRDGGGVRKDARLWWNVWGDAMSSVWSSN
ncbi:hypothetical protein ACHAXA_001817 [Cyclostephanos tholiformis]|uniref:ribonuclease Z n=1 Tax=Cyclostephanos tholiformis TaxID=382380 RepID=A0ABD3SDQ7_9STRA